MPWDFMATFFIDIDAFGSYLYIHGKGHILSSSVLYDRISHFSVCRRTYQTTYYHQLPTRTHVRDTAEKPTTISRRPFKIGGTRAINLWNTHYQHEVKAQTYHAITGEEVGTQKV